MKKGIIAISLMFVMGCASQKSQFIIESGVSPIWAALPITVVAPEVNITPAIFTWNQALGFEAFIEVPVCAYRCAYVIFDDTIPEYAAAVTYLVFDPITGDVKVALVKIRSTLMPWEFSRILIHEFGHVIGLAHDPDNLNSLMFPAALPSSWFFEAEDIKQIKERYHRE